VPDIHGQDALLDRVLARILPLRKSDGGKDKIVFLGDYVDRGVNSHKVIDRLIELKEKYKEKVVCLCGNHELFMMEALELVDCVSPSSSFNMWMMNGGYATLKGYMERAGINESPTAFPRHRVKSLIPDEHKEFLLNLDASYEEDEFVFVHGGCQPDESPANYDLHTIAWDRSLVKFVTRLVVEDKPTPWEKTIICGHSPTGTGEPLVRDKFMMLDCGLGRLLVTEVRSKQAYMAIDGNKRMTKFVMNNTVAPKGIQKTPSFKRVK
jgi:serine/threonine protein phosphatase 1